MRKHWCRCPTASIPGSSVAFSHIMLAHYVTERLVSKATWLSGNGTCLPSSQPPARSDRGISPRAMVDDSCQHSQDHSLLFLSPWVHAGLLHCSHGAYQPMYPAVCPSSLVSCSKSGHKTPCSSSLRVFLNSCGVIPLPVEEKKRIQQNVTAIFTVCPHDL